MALWRWLVVGGGAIIGIVLPAWNALKWLVGWGEHIEFIAHRVHDIHYVGPMLEALLNPPPWLPLASVPVGLFIIWMALRSEKSSPTFEPPAAGLTYLSNRDSELSSAIRVMTLRSAWGRWFSAQNLASDGKPIREAYLLEMATDVVMEKILDGELEIRGRLPGKIDYEQIPPTHWRSSALHFVSDPISLWKMVIVPRGGAEIAPDGTIARAWDAVSAARSAQIAAYDSLVVDAYQFERLWPRKDIIEDKARRQFLRQARKRRLDKIEIQRLS
jgi:hypothetical protein